MEEKCGQSNVSLRNIKSIYVVMHGSPGVVSNVDAFWFDFVSLTTGTSNLV